MEEFLELSNRVSWHDAALGVCFQLGLDGDTIRCDLPVFHLIELIKLIPFLNDSDFEVEDVREILKPHQPAPAGMRRFSATLTPHRAHPHISPTAPTACTTPNTPISSLAPPASSAPSRRQRLTQDHCLRRSQGFSSQGNPGPPADTDSRPPPSVALSSPPPAATDSRLPEPAPRQRPPEPAPPKRPQVPAPPEHHPDPESDPGII